MRAVCEKQLQNPMFLLEFAPIRAKHERKNQQNREDMSRAWIWMLTHTYTKKNTAESVSKCFLNDASERVAFIIITESKSKGEERSCTDKTCCEQNRRY